MCARTGKKKAHVPPAVWGRCAPAPTPLEGTSPGFHLDAVWLFTALADLVVEVAVVAVEVVEVSLDNPRPSCSHPRSSHDHLPHSLRAMVHLDVVLTLLHQVNIVRKRGAAL